MSKRSTRKLRGRVLPMDLESVVRRIYSKSPVGCCMHIVLDDYNTHDTDLSFCLGLATARGHADCIAAAHALGRADEAERGKMISKLMGTLL